jgi:membrane protease YdiL (CAAX protease family)
MPAYQRRYSPDLHRGAAVCAAVALALVLTRCAPSFAVLGPRGALFGWLAYATVVMAGLPGAVMVFGFRRRLSACGLAWGHSLGHAPWIALGLVAAIGLAWALSRLPEIRAYYPQHAFVKSEPLLWIPSTLAFGAYGLSWEMAFRGFLVLGVANELGARRRVGVAAVLAQTVLYAIAHIDKPALEALLSIPAGLFFGWAALRTRSVLPGFLVHFTISTSVNLFCVYG